jgi:lysophospholipase L1-like esterase
MIACNKPVILISNFTSYRSLKTDSLCQVNASYIATLEKLYEELKTENLYYIKGEDIVTEWDYLTSDLLHPSPYGHGEMGRKIAKIIHEDFKIL